MRVFSVTFQFYSTVSCFHFFTGKEGEDDSRMGNVGNAKMQKDEVLKQVEGNIYMDYLKQNMRNKWRMLAYNLIYFPLTGVGMRIGDTEFLNFIPDLSEFLK